MSKKNKNVFTVQTPYPGASTVTLDGGSWNYHIRTGHPGVTASSIQNTLQSPTLVCSDADAPNVGFVSHNERDQKGNALFVVVNPRSGHNARVVTAYHGPKFNNLSNLNVIWTPTSVVPPPEEN